MQPFPLDDKKVTVDIIANEGLEWIKVIARSPKALDLNSSGGNQFGQRSLMDQVKEFVRCSKAHPKLFKIPQVVFVFHHGVSNSLAKRLQRKGIVVRGEVIIHEDQDFNNTDDGSESDGFSEEDSDSDSEEENVLDDDRLESATGEMDRSRLNLDITAMIAYVSALTNGHAHVIFREPILTDQAKWERSRPVRQQLDNIFQGKTAHLLPECLR